MRLRGPSLPAPEGRRHVATGGAQPRSGVLIARRLTVPRTRDLQHLADLLRTIDIVVPCGPNDLRDLTDAADAGYPGYSATNDHATRLLSNADAIFTSLRPHI